MADGEVLLDSPQSPARARPIKERFENAVKVIRSLPQEGSFQPSNTTKLRFYALYKQANEGPCNIPKPNFWDATGRAKWEAWNVCGKMSAELAMQLYVEELQQLVETMPQTKEVEEFIKSIGPFYEIADSEAEGEMEEEGEREEEEKKEEGNSMLTSSEKDDVAEEGGDGNESDSSDESFQESFQEIPNGALVSSGMGGEPQPDEADDQTDGSSATSRSRTGQTRLTGQAGRSGSSTVTFSHVEGRQQRPLLVSAGNGSDSRPPTRRRSDQRSAATEDVGGAAANVEVGSAQSLPLAIDAVTTQLSSLRQNVQSTLRQLNTLAAAVHSLSQVCQQGERSPSSGAAQVRLGVQPHMGPQLVTRKGKLLTMLLKLGPAIILFPLVVNIIMSFLSRRYSQYGTLPRWGWAILTLFQALVSILLMYFNQ